MANGLWLVFRVPGEYGRQSELRPESCWNDCLTRRKRSDRAPHRIVSLEAMNEELLGLDLARWVPSTGVPVLFFLADTIGMRMENWQPLISQPCARRSSDWFGSRNPRTTCRSRNPACSMPQLYASSSR